LICIGNWSINTPNFDTGWGGDEIEATQNHLQGHSNLDDIVRHILRLGSYFSIYGHGSLVNIDIYTAVWYAVVERGNMKRIFLLLALCLPVLAGDVKFEGGCLRKVYVTGTRIQWHGRMKNYQSKPA
jgi:hypothetical protein